MKTRAAQVLIAVAVILLIVYLRRPAAPTASISPPKSIPAAAEFQPTTMEFQPAPATSLDESDPMWDAVDVASAAPTEVEAPEPTPAPEIIREETVQLFERSPRPIEPGSIDTSLRNADYPNTFISAIDIDLASPNHWVRLTWSGPQADRQETGPFRSSPGAGLGSNDCNDAAESNRDGSNCTPKGTFTVEGFNDHLPTYEHCKFVTWFHAVRGIAFHSYSQVANYPASHGCVRVNQHTAQLIHNNSVIGETEVSVGGTWSRR